MSASAGHETRLRQLVLLIRPTGRWGTSRTGTGRGDHPGPVAGHRTAPLRLATGGTLAAHRAQELFGWFGGRRGAGRSSAGQRPERSTSG